MPSDKTYHHGALKQALIDAGAQILARDGIAGLSLRKVARQAGVSHAAPYAHFNDKQDLLAAIAGDGSRRLYRQTRLAAEQFCGDPRRQLLETAWAQLQFALAEPEAYRLVACGAPQHPELAALNRRSFELLVEIAGACLGEEAAPVGRPEMLALGVWSAVHGLAALLLERQFPPAELERCPPRQLLVFVLEKLAGPAPAAVNDAGF